jgi:hypothetical protein
VALVAAAAAPANAQSAIEHALMSGFVASGNGWPEIETLGLASRVGADHGLKSGHNGRKPADPPAPSSTATAATRRSTA